MVDSSDKGQRFDFLEFAYSKEVIRDMPRLISVLDKLIPVLENYRQYTGAWAVLQSAYDSRSLMLIQLAHYNQIYNNKGKIENEEE